MTDRRVLLVTGGGGGIGAATAQRFAADGLDVAIADLSIEAAQRTVEAVEAAGRHAIAVQVDASDADDIGRAVDDVLGQLGRIDVLVNGAGHVAYGALHEIEVARLDLMLDVHLRGSMLFSRAVLPDMIERGWGRILSVSSGAASNGSANHSHYAAAKAGLVGFTKALCREVGPHGVTVNCVLPGAIETAMTLQLAPESRARMAATAVGRIGHPDDVAHALAFLADERSGFITGEALAINGGAYT